MAQPDGDELPLRDPAAPDPARLVHAPAPAYRTENLHRIHLLRRVARAAALLRSAPGPAHRRLGHDRAASAHPDDRELHVLQLADDLPLYVALHRTAAHAIEPLR